MVSRVCLRCGKVLGKNVGGRRKYCSDNCRKRAADQRRRHPGGTKPVSSVRASSSAPVSGCDYADLLRISLTALKRAVEDDGTPANAVAPLTKQLLAVGKEIADLENRPVDPLEEGVNVSGAADEPFDPETL